MYGGLELSDFERFLAREERTLRELGMAKKKLLWSASQGSKIDEEMRELSIFIITHEIAAAIWRQLHEEEIAKALYDKAERELPTGTHPFAIADFVKDKAKQTQSRLPLFLIQRAAQLANSAFAVLEWGVTRLTSLPNRQLSNDLYETWPGRVALHSFERTIRLFRKADMAKIRKHKFEQLASKREQA